VSLGASFERQACSHEASISNPSWFCQNEVPTLPWTRPSSARKRCKSRIVASRPGPSARLRILSPPAPRGLDEATGPIKPNGALSTDRPSGRPSRWPLLFVESSETQLSTRKAPQRQ